MHWKVLLASAALAGSLLAASAASATTKDFVYSDAGSTVATGSFSYATGDTGVLNYGDLTAFSLTVAGVTYDLAEVDTLTDYVHFAYNTATNVFETDTNSCGFDGCGFQSSLSAINSVGTFGFFFNPVPGEYTEYSTDTVGSIDTITITGVPEPATWAMMLFGVAAVGAGLRIARLKDAAALTVA